MHNGRLLVSEGTSIGGGVWTVGGGGRESSNIRETCPLKPSVMFDPVLGRSMAQVDPKLTRVSRNSNSQGAICKLVVVGLGCLGNMLEVSEFPCLSRCPFRPFCPFGHRWIGQNCDGVKTARE